MNKKEIMRLADEQGLVDYFDLDGDSVGQLMLCTLILDCIAAENEECAKVCEEKQEYSMPISCPDGISGCLVAHYVPARREKTGSECAVAIRARKKNE